MPRNWIVKATRPKHKDPVQRSLTSHTTKPNERTPVKKLDRAAKRAVLKKTLVKIAIKRNGSRDLPGKR